MPCIRFRLLHKKGFHSYGRGQITASVFRHNIAGDLILPSVAPRTHGGLTSPMREQLGHGVRAGEGLPSAAGAQELPRDCDTIPMQPADLSLSLLPLSGKAWPSAGTERTD